MEILMMIFVMTIIVLGLFYEQIIDMLRYCLWKRYIKDIHEYDDNVIRNYLNEMAKNCFKYSGDNLPYGRSKWFVTGNENFAKYVNDNLEFYAFSPVRSKEEMDFHEYGIILTQNGIFASWQEGNSRKAKGNVAVSEFFPFEGLWRVDRVKDKDEIKFHYAKGKSLVLNMSRNKEAIPYLIKYLRKFINSGYTNDLRTGSVSGKIDEAISKAQKLEYINDAQMANCVASLGAVIANLPKHFKTETLNGIVNNPQGHGFAAEYANNLVDKVHHPFLDVRRVGQNNAHNGVDRIVGDQLIQTKFCSNASSTVNAAFESKANGGMYRYEGMQLEVPKNQYDKAVELMGKKIEDGKVPGYTKAEDAKLIIKKGSINWEESKLIAQGGNITSLKYDALDGVVMTLPVASISFVVMFAQAKWSGANNKDAAITAAKTSIRTLVVGTVVYAGSQQFAKLFTKEIANLVNHKVAATAVAQKAGYVISFGIIMAPNVFDSLMGRISNQQLLKNTVVAGSGLASGALAGAAAGSFVPGIGNIVGGIVGGIAGSFVSKKVMDQFIEDDRVEMFAILKEEYIDVVMSMSLSEEEFNYVQAHVFDKSLEKKLKLMFAAGEQRDSRLYARKNIVEATVCEIISKREIIDDCDIEYSVEYLNECLA